MPRAASDKKRTAEKLFRAGMKLADIAKKLEIPEGTVRSWKNREGWDCNVAKKKRNVAKETAQRKKAEQSFQLLCLRRLAICIRPLH